MFRYGTVTQKDLIKRVRKSKTAAEERQILAKESAAIRTSIKEDLPRNRTVNVSKLLYLNLLFFPTQYGQMECLKVAASEKISDKRLGYLAVSLLIEEGSPILTLVINCLKNDLNSPLDSVVSLALNTFLSIGKHEAMVQDLLPEVQRHLHHPEARIRKKAAVAVAKIIYAFPDMIECFMDDLENVFANHLDHSVLLSICAMLKGFVQVEPSFKYKFTRYLPEVTKIIRTVLQESFLSEYEINGVPDPFLLCSLLQLVRLIVPGIDAQMDDNSDNYQSIVSDCLIFLVGVIDEDKGASNCILYEVVRIILHFPYPDHSLVLLAVNVLAKFISHSDHNLRFIALGLLSKFASIDLESVQNHRERIFECLSDPDISIKHAAIQLMFELVNKETWKLTLSELCCFYLDCNCELKQYMIRKLIDCLNQFARDDFDFYKSTILKLLKKSNTVTITEDLVDSIIIVVEKQKEPVKKAFLNNSIMTELPNAFENHYVGMISFYLVGSHVDLIFDCPLLMMILTRFEGNALFNSNDVVFGENSLTIDTSSTIDDDIKDELWNHYLDCLFKVCSYFCKPEIFLQIASKWLKHERLFLSEKVNLYSNALKLKNTRLSFDSLNSFNVEPGLVKSSEKPSFSCNEFVIYTQLEHNLPNENVIKGRFIISFLHDEHYAKDIKVEAAVTNVSLLPLFLLSCRISKFQFLRWNI